MALMLLNREVVSREMLEWFRLKIAEVHGVPSKRVAVHWELRKGQLWPEFEIEIREEEYDTDRMKQLIGLIYARMRLMTIERLEGLTQRRVTEA